LCASWGSESDADGEPRKFEAMAEATRGNPEDAPRSLPAVVEVM
jgi:hypothetical protein